MTERKQRTGQQNRALHKYCSMLSDALNDAGYDVRTTLKQDFEIPWNQRLIKELIWRPVQEAIAGVESTTELNTVDPSEIYEVINRHMAEKFGVSISWPSYDDYLSRKD